MSVEDLETRIVAMCEAIGAGVTRASLWERFSDDFETEGDLAKCLGRLTASGRLYRGARKRPGLSDEFIYSASPVAADPVARANPASLKSFVDSHREPVLPNLAAAPSKPETPPMSKTSDARQRYIDHLASTRTWLAPSEIAKALKVKPELTSYHLNVALEHKQLQAIGHRSTRKFAALGVALPADPSKATPAPAADPPKRERSKARETAPAPAPEPRRDLVPIAASEPLDEDQVRCAIEDTGLFAINDGKTTIRLMPRAIRKVIGFLELTQHVWKGAA
jgi:hypothetical protein